MRGGQKDSTPNYLLAHIAFVVTDQKHCKNSENKYEGGRTYIDFPIGAKDVDNIGKYPHYIKGNIANKHWLLS